MEIPNNRGISVGKFGMFVGEFEEPVGEFEEPVGEFGMFVGEFEEPVKFGMFVGEFEEPVKVGVFVGEFENPADEFEKIFENFLVEFFGKVNDLKNKSLRKLNHKYFWLIVCNQILIFCKLLR